MSLNIHELFNNQMLFNPFKSKVFGLIELNSGGDVIKADGRAGKLLGYNSSELLGKNIKQFFENDNAETFDLSGLNEAVTETFEKQWLRKDGSSFSAEMSVIGVDPQVRAIGFERRSSERTFLGFIHDLTQEKEQVETNASKLSLTY